MNLGQNKSEDSLHGSPVYLDSFPRLEKPNSTIRPLNSFTTESTRTREVVLKLPKYKEFLQGLVSSTKLAAMEKSGKPPKGPVQELRLVASKKIQDILGINVSEQKVQFTGKKLDGVPYVWRRNESRFISKEDLKKIEYVLSYTLDRKDGKDSQPKRWPKLMVFRFIAMIKHGIMIPVLVSQLSGDDVAADFPSDKDDFSIPEAEEAHTDFEEIQSLEVDLSTENYADSSIDSDCCEEEESDPYAYGPFREITTRRMAMSTGKQPLRRRELSPELGINDESQNEVDTALPVIEVAATAPIPVDHDTPTPSLQSRKSFMPSREYLMEAKLFLDLAEVQMREKEEENERLWEEVNRLQRELKSKQVCSSS